MPGVLISIQQSIVDTLMADDYFVDNDLIVIPEYKGDIDTTLSAAIDALGIGFIITVPSAQISPKARNLPGPYFDSIQIQVQGYERVTINQDDGPRLEDAMEVIATLLHATTFPGVHEGLYAAEDFLGACQRGSRVGKAVNFVTKGGLSRARSQCATVGIADNGSGSITLTCATTHTAIYYTVDGKTPGSENGLLYTAPFAIASGVTVKAQAWRPGKLPSVQSTYTRA